MALSRAAAKTARQIAQSRGLQGNRGQDGSMLTRGQDNSMPTPGSKESYLIEEFGGREKFPDIDENSTPAEIRTELNDLDKEIEKFEDILDETIDELDEADPYANDFTIGLLERQLRDLKERKNLLEDILNRGFEAATEVSF